MKNIPLNFYFQPSAINTALKPAIKDIGENHDKDLILVINSIFYSIVIPWHVVN